MLSTVKILVATVSVVGFTAGAIILTGCVTAGNWEIGLGRVDDPSSDDPADSGWGIVIRPTGSNPDFEDKNEEDGNICLTCKNDIVPLPLDSDEPPWAGCWDTIWGCEDPGSLRLSASHPMGFENSTGQGTIWVYEADGTHVSSQNHAWDTAGSSVAPVNAASLSGMIDYNLSLGHMVVYEAVVPLNVYSPDGDFTITSGTFEADDTSIISQFGFFVSTGEACESAPPGSLPTTAQASCGAAGGF